jgi:WD40 repeat protein
MKHQLISVTVIILSLVINIQARVQNKDTISDSKKYLLQDLKAIAYFAHQYQIKPKSLNGGGGSYLGYQLPEEFKKSPNGTYYINNLGSFMINLNAVSNDLKDTIMLTMDENGHIFGKGFFGKASPPYEYFNRKRINETVKLLPGLFSHNKNISWINWTKHEASYNWVKINDQEWDNETPDGILSAIFLHDGETAIIGEAHRVVVWNTKTGQIKKNLSMNMNPTMSICCLPSDSLFATATGKVISFWNANSFLQYDTIYESGAISEMDFSNDGKLMYTISDSAGRNLRLWDFRKKQLLKDFRKQFHNVYSANFSNDGHLLLLGVDSEIGGPDIQSYSTLLWDVYGNKIVQRHRNDMQRPTCVRFSPNGKFIASGFEYIESKWGDYNDTTLRVWDVSSGDFIQGFTDFQSSISSITFSPQNDLIASVAKDGSINIRELSNTNQVIELRKDIAAQAPIVFSPDGRQLLSGSPSMKALIWNLKSNSITKILDSKIKLNSNSSISAIVYSYDGRYAYSVDLKGDIIAWDILNGNPLWKLNSSLNGGQRLSISHDNKFIAYGNHKTIKIWQVSNHKLIAELKGHHIPEKYKNQGNDISDYVFSSDNKYLASGSIDGDVRIWDIASWKCLKTLNNPFDSWLGVHSLMFDDKDSIIIAGYSGFIVGWDINRQEILYKLTDDSIKIYMINKLYKLNTSTLLSISSNERRSNCRLWDISSGNIIKRFSLDYYSKNSISLSPDKKYIAFGNYEKPPSLNVLEISSGKLMYQLEADITVITALEWAPDIKNVFSGSIDGSIILWNIPQISN